MRGKPRDRSAFAERKHYRIRSTYMVVLYVVALHYETATKAMESSFSCEHLGPRSAFPDLTWCAALGHHKHKHVTIYIQIFTIHLPVCCYSLDL